MAVIAYLIPFLFCLLLYFGFDYQGRWHVYVWLIIGGEIFIILVHTLLLKWQTRDTEYLGSLIREVHHEEPWVELVPRTVTRRDSRGNTHTSVQIVEQYHPEKYYFDTTSGSRIYTDRNFYTYVLGKWLLPPLPIRWTDRRIKGGVRYGNHRKMDFFNASALSDDPRWVSITEKHTYTNRIRKSHSIFKPRNIRKDEADQMGLFEYPRIVYNDAPCILTQNLEIPLFLQEKFRRFNGAFAPQRQMRLFILIFDAESAGAAISQYQREYWQGGNKNEFVVCLGVDRANRVDWARVFSWADNQQLEIETAQWFLRNPTLDLDRFYEWFIRNFHVWQRKSFSDFKYVTVTLQGWQFLCLILLSILENSLVLFLILKS